MLYCPSSFLIYGYNYRCLGEMKAVLCSVSLKTFPKIHMGNSYVWKERERLLAIIMGRIIKAKNNA